MRKCLVSKFTGVLLYISSFTAHQGKARGQCGVPANVAAEKRCPPATILAALDIV